jgi:hypothetical protein
MMYVPAVNGTDPYIDVINLAATVVNNEPTMREQILGSVKHTDTLACAAVDLLAMLAEKSPAFSVYLAKAGRNRLAALAA